MTALEEILGALRARLDSRRDVRGLVLGVRILENVASEVADLRGGVFALRHELQGNATDLALHVVELNHAYDVRHDVHGAQAIRTGEVQPLHGSDTADVDLGLEEDSRGADVAASWRQLGIDAFHGDPKAADHTRASSRLR